MSSIDFAQRAPNSVSVDTARQALNDMGMPELPYSILNSSQRSQFLDMAPRMTPEQIADFLSRVKLK